MCSKLSADADKQQQNLADGLEDDDDTSVICQVEPGAVFSLLTDKPEEQLQGSELGNCSNGDEDVEQNKENALQSFEEFNAIQTVSVETLVISKRKQEETEDHVRSSFWPEKVQKRGILTSHSFNVNDPRTCTNAVQSNETGLSEMFGYKRSLKTGTLADHSSVDSRENAVPNAGVPVMPVDVIDIESGYLSDTEMSTDGDTPTPTPSAVASLTPLPSGGNLPLRLGSAVGTKVCFFL